MYLRTTTVRRGSKTYHYAQIVESYRREDGTPTNRIIASLGSRDETEIAAIRAALEIARKGGTPVFPLDGVPQVQVLLCLRYLDVAVLRRAWQQFGLRSLLREALGNGNAIVEPLDVIEALVLQRCLAPGSKLAASRWYPTTALPELQGVDPTKFNNSRVHRTLSSLEAAETQLQELLPEHLFATLGEPSVFFLDATDTWFEGDGPPLAAKGKDKLGVYRQRVGLVLLCDGHGLPLRWHTLDGRFHDPTALGDMATEVANLSWAKAVPMVIDRALGSAGWVSKLDDLKIRYVTCVPAPELNCCGAPIPWKLLEELQECGGNLKSMQSKVLAAGFVHDDNERYVLELGIFNKSHPKSTKRLSQAQIVLRNLQEIEAASETSLDMAQRLKMSRASFFRYKKLMSLGSQVRQRIENGDASALSIRQLQKVAAVPAEQQLDLFDALVATANDHYRQARRDRIDGSGAEPLLARGALSLNLQRFIDDRQADEERLARIRSRVDDVNRRLANPRSHRKDSSALAEVGELVRRLAMGDLCSTSMEDMTEGRRVVLHVDDGAWRRRRRSDGIALVISHPDVRGTAQERVIRYFSKDAIEKDFQSIKSVLGLRPVRHRTDHKLRAHVTICVLALLLTRLIEKQLGTVGKKRTLTGVIDNLEPVRLNLIDDGRNRYYAAAQPGEDARVLLRTLDMEQLVDAAAISKEVTPR